MSLSGSIGRYISMKQLEIELREIGRMAEGNGRWSWIPQNRKIVARMVRETRKRFRGHKTPTGKKWEKAWSPLPIKKGKSGPVAMHNGKFVWRPTVSARQARRATRIARYEGLMIPPNQPALYRTNLGHAHNASILQSILTDGGIHGKAVNIWKTGFRYGFVGGAHWAVPLQYGGVFNKVKYKGREFLGMNTADIRFAVKTYSESIKRKLNRAS